MSAYAAPSAAELHLLFTLSDSALPTGGFIASSGLESYAKHGFLVSPSSPASFSSYPNPASSPSQALTEFARAEVEHYANTTAVFVISAFKCVESALSISTEEKGREKPIDELVHVDAFHEATLLSHVSRRSSKAQGVALLTLFSRGLAVPTGFGPSTSDPKHQTELDPAGERGGRDIVMGYKRLIRAGRAMGHLAVCWGVMTAVLGLSLGTSFILLSFPIWL